MARVEHLQEKTMERNRVHETVEATFTVFVDEDGAKYLQIDTYGTAHRAIPGKVSQSIQFTKESIRQLRAIIEREFGDV